LFFFFICPEFIGICQWDVYPWGCEDNPDLECTGEYSIILGWVSMLLLFAASMTGFVAVFMVYRTVRRQVQGVHEFANFSASVFSDEMIQRAERVKVQAILYSAVYFNSFIWPAVTGFVGEMIDPELYSNTCPSLLIYLCYLFYPLQGLGNFCVYVYPSIQRWRRAEPDLSLINVLWKVLQGQEPRPARRPSSGTRTSAQNLTVGSPSSWSGLFVAKKQSKESSKEDTGSQPFRSGRYTADISDSYRIIDESDRYSVQSPKGESRDNTTAVSSKTDTNSSTGRSAEAISNDCTEESGGIIHPISEEADEIEPSSAAVLNPGAPSETITDSPPLLQAPSPSIPVVNHEEIPSSYH
jgi:hypothetical protein